MNCAACGRGVRLVPSDRQYFNDLRCLGCDKLAVRPQAGYSTGKLSSDDNACWCAPLGSHRIATELAAIAEQLKELRWWDR